MHAWRRDGQEPLDMGQDAVLGDAVPGGGSWEELEDVFVAHGVDRL